MLLRGRATFQRTLFKVNHCILVSQCSLSILAGQFHCFVYCLFFSDFDVLFFAAALAFYDIPFIYCVYNTRLYLASFPNDMNKNIHGCFK